MVTLRWLRAVRNCCAVGRSGFSWKRDWPALAMSWPVPFQIGAVGQNDWVILAVRNQKLQLDPPR
jgi:hypothetical protein